MLHEILMNVNIMEEEFDSIKDCLDLSAVTKPRQYSNELLVVWVMIDDYFFYSQS